MQLLSLFKSRKLSFIYIVANTNEVCLSANIKRGKLKYCIEAFVLKVLERLDWYFIIIEKYSIKYHTVWSKAYPKITCLK